MADALQRTLSGVAAPEDVAIRADGGRIAVLDTRQHRFRWSALPTASTWSNAGAYVNGAGAGFAFPEAALFDQQDNLIVLDLWNRRVVRYLRQAAGYSYDAAFAPAAGLSPGGVPLGYARDIAADAAGRLYVLDPDNKRIVRWDGAATAVQLPATIRDTWGFALRTGGGYFVADRDGHRIVALSAAGAVDFQFGAYGQSPGQLRFPQHVTVAPNGNVWVADTDNNRVQEFSAGGTFIRVVLEAQQFREIRRLRFAPNGWLYIADPGARAIHEVADAVPPKALYVSRASVNFGGVGMNTTAEQVVTLRNVGTDPVQVTKADTTGAPFTRTLAGSVPLTIPTGGSTEVHVRFAPTALEAYSELLLIESDAIQNIGSVRLGGYAELVPDWNVVWAIDHSKSMNGRFREIVKIKLIRQTIPLFPREPFPPPPPPPPYAPDVRVGLVLFNETAQVGLPLTSVGRDTPKAIERVLTQLGRPSGSTSVRAGLDAAFAMLEGVAGRGSVILVTDGVDNAHALSPDLPLPDGVAVHVVALGNTEDVDAPALAELAERSGGTFRVTGRDPDLAVRTLTHATADALRLQVVTTETLEVGRGGEARLPFTLHRSDRDVSLLLTQDDPRLPLEALLVAPGRSDLDDLSLNEVAGGGRALSRQLPLRSDGGDGPTRRSSHAGRWEVVVRPAGRWGRDAVARVTVGIVTDSDLVMQVESSPPLLQRAGSDRLEPSRQTIVGDDIRFGVRVSDRTHPVADSVHGRAHVIAFPRFEAADGNDHLSPAQLRRRVVRDMRSEDPAGIRATAASFDRANGGAAALHDVAVPLEPDASPGADALVASLGPASTPGAHCVLIRAQIRGADGRRSMREKLVTALVLPEVSPAHSDVDLSRAEDGRWRLHFRPRDRFGRELGPGWAADLRPDGDAVATSGAVTDVGDGTYVVEFVPTAAEVSEPDRVTLRLGAIPIVFPLPPLERVEDQWRQRGDAPFAAEAPRPRAPAREHR